MRTRNWYRNKAAQGCLRVPTWTELNGPYPEAPDPEAVQTGIDGAPAMGRLVLKFRDISRFTDKINLPSHWPLVCHLCSSLVIWFDEPSASRGEP